MHLVSSLSASELEISGKSKKTHSALTASIPIGHTVSPESELVSRVTPNRPNSQQKQGGLMEVIPRNLAAHYHNHKPKIIGFASPGRKSDRNLNSDPHIRAGSKQKSSLKGKKKKLRANIGVGEKLLNLGLQDRLVGDKETTYPEMLASTSNQMLTSCPTGFGLRDAQHSPNFNTMMFERATTNSLEQSGGFNQYFPNYRNDVQDGPSNSSHDGQRETYPMFGVTQKLPLKMFKANSKDTLGMVPSRSETANQPVATKKKITGVHSKQSAALNGSQKLENILIQADAPSAKQKALLDEYLLKSKLKTSHSHTSKQESENGQVAQLGKALSKKKTLLHTQSNKQKVIYCQDNAAPPPFVYPGMPGLMFQTQSSLNAFNAGGYKTSSELGSKYQGVALSSSTKLPAYPISHTGNLTHSSSAVNSCFSPRLLMAPSKKARKQKSSSKTGPASSHNGQSAARLMMASSAHTLQQPTASISSKAASTHQSIFTKTNTFLSTSKSRSKMNAPKSSKAAKRPELEMMSHNLVNLGQILLKNKLHTEGNDQQPSTLKTAMFERLPTESKLKSHRNHSGNQEQLVMSIGARNSPKRPASSAKQQLSNLHWQDTVASGQKMYTQTTFEGTSAAAKTPAQFSKHHQHHFSNQGVSSTASGGIGGLWTQLAEGDAATATVYSYGHEELASGGNIGFNSKSSAGLTFGNEKPRNPVRKSTEMVISSSNVSNQHPGSESHLSFKKHSHKPIYTASEEHEGHGNHFVLKRPTVESVSNETASGPVVPPALSKELLHRAAIIIQTAVRGWIERNRLQVLKKVEALKPKPTKVKSSGKEILPITLHNAKLGVPAINNHRRFSHEAAPEAPASLKQVLDHKLAVPERKSLRSSDKVAQSSDHQTAIQMVRPGAVSVHEPNGLGQGPLSSHELSGSLSLKEGFMPNYSNSHLMTRINMPSSQKLKHPPARQSGTKVEPVEEYRLKSAESKLDPTINFKVPNKTANSKREGLKLDVLGVYPSSNIFQTSQLGLASPQSAGGATSNFKRFAKEDYRNWQKVGAWVQAISSQLGDSAAGDVQQLIKQLSQFAEQSKKMIKDQYLPNESAISYSENTKSVLYEGNLTHSGSKVQPYCFERKVAIRGATGNKGSLDLQLGSFQAGPGASPASAGLNPSNSLVLQFKQHDSLRELGLRSGEQSPKTNIMNTQRSISKRSGRIDIDEKWVEPAPNALLSGNFSPQHSVASGVLSGMLISNRNYLEQTSGSQTQKLALHPGRTIPTTNNVFIEGAGHLSRGGLILLQETLSRGTLSHKASIISNGATESLVYVGKQPYQQNKVTGVESSETRVIADAGISQVGNHLRDSSTFGKDSIADQKAEETDSNFRRSQNQRERNSAFSSLVPPLQFTSAGTRSNFDSIVEDGAQPIRRPPDQDPDRLSFKDRLDSQLEELDQNLQKQSRKYSQLESAHMDKERYILADEIESTDTKLQNMHSRPSNEMSSEVTVQLKPNVRFAAADRPQDQNLSAGTIQEGSSAILSTNPRLAPQPEPNEGLQISDQPEEVGQDNFEQNSSSLPISPIGTQGKTVLFPFVAQQMQNQTQGGNSSSGMGSKEGSAMGEHKDSSQRGPNSSSEKNGLTLERPSYRSVFSRGFTNNDRDDLGNMRVTPYESVEGMSRPVSGGEQSFDQYMQDDIDKVKAAAATFMLERSSYRSSHTQYHAASRVNHHQSDRERSADEAEDPLYQPPQVTTLGPTLTIQSRKTPQTTLNDKSKEQSQSTDPQPINQSKEIDLEQDCTDQHLAQAHTSSPEEVANEPEEDPELHNLEQHPNPPEINSETLTPLFKTESDTSSPTPLAASVRKIEHFSLFPSPEADNPPTNTTEVPLQSLSDDVDWKPSEIQVCKSRLLNKLKMPTLPVPADIIRSMREYECYVTQNMEEFIYPLPRGFQPQAKHLLDDRIWASFREDQRVTKILEQNHPSVIIRPPEVEGSVPASWAAPVSQEAQKYQSTFNRCIFDAFNEALTLIWARESDQNFVELATQLPPAAHPDEESFSKLLQSAKDMVLQHCALVCGLLDSFGSQAEDPLLKYIREERLSKLIAQEALAGEKDWKNTSREALVVLVDCADRVCEELVGETVAILLQIGLSRQTNHSTA